MKDLSSLLGRFLKSLGKDVLAKETVIEAIENSTGFKILPEEISIKENVLTLSLSSAGKKNEINLKEERILDEIRGRTGQNINKIFYK